MRLGSLIIYFALFFCLTANGNPQVIKIGFIPGDAPEKTKQSAEELSKFLSKRLGIPVKPFIPNSYQELINSMKANEIDFAFFSALTFVFAEKEAGAKVLMKKVWAEPFYYSVIVAKKSSKIRKIEQLKNKTIAFVDEKSASGFLYPSVEFKKRKIEANKFFKKILFKGNHQAAVHAVISGEADAAAIYSDDKSGKDSAWVRYGQDKGKDQFILWRSEAIPNDPFCVRKDFYEKYPQLTHNMMFAFFELNDEPKELKRLLDVKEMKPATSKQYDPVREMVKEMNLRLEP